MDVQDPVSLDATSVVVARLREAILKGGLAPGAPLNQEALAEDFGVSRMPVRQALKRLQAEGLVQQLTNRRLQVATLRRSEIEDIFDMRLALEPLGLRLAVPQTTPADLRASARALEDAGDETDPSTFGMRNTAYHMALVAPCRRPRLLGELRSLLDLSDRYQRAAVADAPFRRPLQDEHERIYAAVAGGDADLAVEILHGHLRAGRDRLLELFADDD
jgi:DNA-binding GntR family transcriptional regulator